MSMACAYYYGSPAQSPRVGLLICLDKKVTKRSRQKKASAHKAFTFGRFSVRQALNIFNTNLLLQMKTGRKRWLVWWQGHSNFCGSRGYEQVVARQKIADRGSARFAGQRLVRQKKPDKEKTLLLFLVSKVIANCTNLYFNSHSTITNQLFLNKFYYSPILYIYLGIKK